MVVRNEVPIHFKFSTRLIENQNWSCLRPLLLDDSHPSSKTMLSTQCVPTKKEKCPLPNKEER